VSHPIVTSNKPKPAASAAKSKKTTKSLGEAHPDKDIRRWAKTGNVPEVDARQEEEKKRATEVRRKNFERQEKLDKKEHKREKE